MSMAKKAGLLIGVIGAAATVATTAEARRRQPPQALSRLAGLHRRAASSLVHPAPVYVMQPPPVVYAPAPTYYEPMYQRYDRYDRYPSSPSLNINIPLR